MLLDVQDDTCQIALGAATEGRAAAGGPGYTTDLNVHAIVADEFTPLCSDVVSSGAHSELEQHVCLMSAEDALNASAEDVVVNFATGGDLVCTRDVVPPPVSDATNLCNGVPSGQITVQKGNSSPRQCACLLWTQVSIVSP